MKKYLSFIAVFLLIASISFYNRTEIANAIGSVLRSGLNVPTGSLAMETSTATSTSPVYMQNGTATTTLTFASEGFDDAVVYLTLTASSTSGAFSSALNIQPQASDDNVNFFDYDLTKVNPALTYQASSTIALASSTVAYSWKPSSITAYSSSALQTTKAFNMNILPSRYTRLIFTLAASTTNYTQRDSVSLWANVIGKTNGVK